MRATLSNVYDLDKFSFVWNTQYISDTYDSMTDADKGIGEGRVPSWVTHDLQVSYNASWGGKLSISAQNAFDKQPPLLVGLDRGGYNFDYHLYNGYGRIVYMQYTQTF